MIVNLGFGMFTPILPQYANLLGIDATVLSYVYSLYNVALIVCLIPAGIMADRLDRVKTIVIGMILFAVSSLMLAFVKDLTQFAIARTIEGVGSALATPAVFALTADLAPTDRRGSGMGFTATLETVGYLASPTVGGIIADLRVNVSLLCGFLVGPVVGSLCSSNQGSSTSSWLFAVSIVSSCSLQITTPKPLGEQKPTDTLLQRVHHRHHPRALRAIFVLYMSFRLGMAPVQIGFAFSLISGSILAFTFFAGHFSDRYGRKPFVILGGIIIASGVAAFSFANSLLEVYLVCLILGLGVALNNAPINALLADSIIPDMRAKVMGGYEVIVSLGRTLGLLLLGGLYMMSVAAPFYIIGASMLLTVVLVALFVREPIMKHGKGSAGRGETLGTIEELRA